MTSELRRAAETVVAADRGTCILDDAIDSLEAALSAPDELAEAREIIELLTSDWIFDRINVSARAREFMKRTEGK